LRSDLTKACVPCAWRIASDNQDCPRCGGVLVPPRTALEALTDPKKLSTKLGRPTRDLLLYGSGALFSVASIVGGAAVAISSVFLESFQGSYGMAAIMFVLSVFAFTAALMIMLGCVWAILAVPILLVSWLANRGQGSTLRVAAFAHEAGVGHEPPRAKWLDAFNAWILLRKKRLIFGSILGIAAIELLAESFADTPYFWNHSLVDNAKLLGLAAVAQVIALAFLMVPSVGAVQWALWSFDHLRRVRHLLRERGVQELAADLDAHRHALESERGQVDGRVMNADAAPLIAPLSGDECLGFRLTGRVGSALLDDAFVASEVEVQNGDERTRVRAERVILSIPEPTERVQELAPEQKMRVASWLAKLGLPESNDVELGESMLREGNRVNAHGAESREPARGEGYRDASHRTLLDDSDGVPVVIRR
jgi:hypothetical protein